MSMTNVKMSLEIILKMNMVNMELNIKMHRANVKMNLANMEMNTTVCKNRKQR